VFRERLLSADKAMRPVIDEERYNIFLGAVPFLVYVAVVYTFLRNSVIITPKLMGSGISWG
jgi:hypothetical protein